jgi:hypothetical protein
MWTSLVKNVRPAGDRYTHSQSMYRQAIVLYDRPIQGWWLPASAARTTPNHLLLVGSPDADWVTPGGAAHTYDLTVKSERVRTSTSRARFGSRTVHIDRGRRFAKTYLVGVPCGQLKGRGRRQAVSGTEIAVYQERWLRFAQRTKSRRSQSSATRYLIV